MKLYLSLVLTLAACGDNSKLAPDAPVSHPEHDAATDATVCDASNYPVAVRKLSVDLGADFTLTLDGNGTRCDQIIRALTDPDPAKRPPELAMLDVQGVTGSCTHDDTLNRDIIRLKAPLYGGKPLYGAVQDVLVHIGHPNTALPGPTTVVYLHGDFLAAGAAIANPACLDDAALPGAVVGHALTFAKFDHCNYQGDGSYALAADDVFQLGEAGYFLDDQSQLHRVRAVDAYLLPGHLTDETLNSDLFCCTGMTYDNCVGDRVFVDEITGAVLGQTQHCQAC